MKAKKIWFDQFVNLEMEDGSTARLPLSDFPRLKFATEEQRADYTLSPYGIHWEGIDEDLSYEGFFAQNAEYPNAIAKTLKSFPEINVNQLARRMGVNQSLLAKYICGAKKPSEGRLKEIEQALHELGRELSAVSL
jgi:transcriptional regulator with XRE-family HTH domain